MGNNNFSLDTRPPHTWSEVETKSGEKKVACTNCHAFSNDLGNKDRCSGNPGSWSENYLKETAKK